ncbi:hypothetical protein B0I35DRAFT_236579 [Stachybotrys elegans]|uniref:Uncharacterized protein n=1 Tax=Stachybotrys elegans TaxID=80388 RepID=A0A8K0SUQ1_9HYPO|nr:hypothetical protein B0I35DRAFT_236579 [Stachybotrys elegans]
MRLMAISDGGSDAVCRRLSAGGCLRPCCAIHACAASRLAGWKHVWLAPMTLTIHVDTRQKEVTKVNHRSICMSSSLSPCSSPFVSSHLLITNTFSLCRLSGSLPFFTPSLHFAPQPPLLHPVLRGLRGLHAPTTTAHLLFRARGNSCAQGLVSHVPFAPAYFVTPGLGVAPQVVTPWEHDARFLTTSSTLQPKSITASATASLANHLINILDLSQPITLDMAEAAEHELNRRANRARPSLVGMTALELAS